MQKQKKQTHIKHVGADSGVSFAVCNVSSLYRLAEERNEGIIDYLHDRSHFEDEHIAPEGGR